MARNNKPEPTPEPEEFLKTQPGEQIEWLISGDPAPEVPVREVARIRNFSDSDLAAIDSWDAAMAAAKATYGDVVDASDALGNGFRKADDDQMERLCGVPLLLLEWDFYPGDFGEDFVSVRVIQRLANGGIAKWIVNDGSTGICKQLREYQNETGATGGVGFPRGFRMSKFYFDPDTGHALTKQETREGLIHGRKMQPARTFYLDTSA